MFASAFLLIFFHFYMISGNLDCNFQVVTYHQAFSLTDCQAAIDMIPNLTWAVNPASSGDRSQSKIIDVRLDRPERKDPDLPDRPVRKAPLLLPAAFRSRSCVVLVGPSPRWLEPAGSSRVRFQLPVQAASAMYSKVWPEVRRAATMIIERCHFQTDPIIWTVFNAGLFTGNISMDGQQFYWYVMVRPTPRRMPGEGWKVFFGSFGGFKQWYNVYEVDGANISLPRGYTRGFWRFLYGKLPLRRSVVHLGPLWAGGLFHGLCHGPPVQIVQPGAQPVSQEESSAPMN
jgi:hypothetical protein